VIGGHLHCFALSEHPEQPLIIRKEVFAKLIAIIFSLEAVFFDHVEVAIAQLHEMLTRLLKVCIFGRGFGRLALALAKRRNAMRPASLSPLPMTSSS
jgi:hypothetical protein